MKPVTSETTQDIRLAINTIFVKIIMVCFCGLNPEVIFKAVFFVVVVVLVSYLRQQGVPGIVSTPCIMYCMVLSR